MINPKLLLKCNEVCEVCMRSKASPYVRRLKRSVFIFMLLKKGR